MSTERRPKKPVEGIAIITKYSETPVSRGEIKSRRRERIVEGTYESRAEAGSRGALKGWCRGVTRVLQVFQGY
jgi:hypothetical protein